MPNFEASGYFAGLNPGLAGDGIVWPRADKTSATGADPFPAAPGALTVHEDDDFGADAIMQVEGLQGSVGSLTRFRGSWNVDTQSATGVSDCFRVTQCRILSPAFNQVSFFEARIAAVDAGVCLRNENEGQHGFFSTAIQGTDGEGEELQIERIYVEAGLAGTTNFEVGLWMKPHGDFQPRRLTSMLIHHITAVTPNYRVERPATLLIPPGHDVWLATSINDTVTVRAGFIGTLSTVLRGARRPGMIYTELN